MPNSPTPKLVANCPDLCSLHPDKIGSAATEALLAARANGAGADSMAALQRLDLVGAQG